MKIIFFTLSILLFFPLQGDTRTYTNKNESYNFNLLKEFDYYLKHAEDNLNKNLDSSFYYIRQAEEIVDTTSELEKTLLYMSKSSYGFYSSSDKNEIIPIAIKGLHLAQKNEFTYYEFKFHTLLAFLYNTNSSESLQHNLKTLEISKKMNNIHHTIATLINLTLYEIQSRDYNQAKIYLKELEPLLKEKDIRPDFRAKYYINQSRVSTELNHAQNYLDSALNIAKNHNLDQLLITIYAIKAKNYNEFKLPKRAIKYYEKTDSLTTALGQPKVTDQYNLARAKLYLDIKDYIRAKEFHSLHINSKYSKSEFSDAGALEIGYKIYKNLGETKKSLDYLERYLEKYIENTDKRRDSLFVEYENRYQLYDLEMEAKLKNEELKNQTLINKITSTGLIIIITLISLIFVQKNKKNKIKISLTEELLNKQRELNTFRKQALENIVSQIKNPLTILKGTVSFLSLELNQGKYAKILEFGNKNINTLQYDVEEIIEILASTPHDKNSNTKNVKLLPIFSKLIYSLQPLYENKNIQILVIHNLQNASYCSLEDKMFITACKTIISELINISNYNSSLEIYITASDNNLKINFESSNITNIKYAKSIYEVYETNTDTNQQNNQLSLLDNIDKLNGNISVNYNSHTSSIFITFLTSNSCYHFLNNQNIIEIGQQLNNEPPIDEINTPPKILIIDPDLLMTKFYKLIFNNTFDIDLVPNKEQAIKMLSKNKYKCIVSDIPADTTNSLVTYIDQLTLNRTIPMVLITGNTLEEIRINAYESGVQDFITKPFIIREFITRIQNVINNHSLKLKHLDNQENNDDIEYDPNLLQRIINNIEKNMSTPDFNIEDLAESVFYSKRQLSRITTRLTGLTPAKLILERRLLKAYDTLKTNPEMRLSEIQNLVGIKSSSYFIKVFKTRFGITPGSIKSNHVL